MKLLVLASISALAMATSQAGFLGFGDVEFIPYEGDQTHWKTAPGASVDRSYKLPIYYGRPPRSYRVLGTIAVSGTGGFTQEASAIRDAISEARKQGADAVIMMERGVEGTGHGNLLGNAQTGFTFVERKSGRATVLAIRWVK